MFEGNMKLLALCFFNKEKLRYLEKKTMLHFWFDTSGMLATKNSDLPKSSTCCDPIVVTYSRFGRE